MENQAAVRTQTKKKRLHSIEHMLFWPCAAHSNESRRLFANTAPYSTAQLSRHNNQADKLIAGIRHIK